jgi:hypothetical protein
VSESAVLADELGRVGLGSVGAGAAGSGLAVGLGVDRCLRLALAAGALLGAGLVSAAVSVGVGDWPRVSAGSAFGSGFGSGIAGDRSVSAGPGRSGLVGSDGLAVGSGSLPFAVVAAALVLGASAGAGVTFLLTPALGLVVVFFAAARGAALGLR